MSENGETSRRMLTSIGNFVGSGFTLHKIHFREGYLYDVHDKNHINNPLTH